MRREHERGLAGWVDELQARLDRGDLEGAMETYFDCIGGYRHLAWRDAEYAVGLRLASALCEAGGVSRFHRDYSSPWFERAQFRKDLGDVNRAVADLDELARECQRTTSAPWRYLGSERPIARHLVHGPLALARADALVALGRLPEAEAILDEQQRSSNSGPDGP